MAIAISLPSGLTSTLVISPASVIPIDSRVIVFVASKLMLLSELTLLKLTI